MAKKKKESENQVRSSGMGSTIVKFVLLAVGLILSAVGITVGVLAAMGTFNDKKVFPQDFGFEVMMKNPLYDSGQNPDVPEYIPNPDTLKDWPYNVYEEFEITLTAKGDIAEYNQRTVVITFPKEGSYAPAVNLSLNERVWGKYAPTGSVYITDGVVIVPQKVKLGVPFTVRMAKANNAVPGTAEYYTTASNNVTSEEMANNWAEAISQKGALYNVGGESVLNFDLGNNTTTAHAYINVDVPVEDVTVYAVDETKQAIPSVKTVANVEAVAENSFVLGSFFTAVPVFTPYRSEFRYGRDGTSGSRIIQKKLVVFDTLSNENGRIEQFVGTYKYETPDKTNPSKTNIVERVVQRGFSDVFMAGRLSGNSTIQAYCFKNSIIEDVACTPSTPDYLVLEGLMKSTGNGFIREKTGLRVEDVTITSFSMEASQAGSAVDQIVVPINKPVFLYANYQKYAQTNVTYSSGNYDLGILIQDSRGDLQPSKVTDVVIAVQKSEIVGGLLTWKDASSDVKFTGSTSVSVAQKPEATSEDVKLTFYRPRINPRNAYASYWEIVTSEDCSKGGYRFVIGYVTTNANGVTIISQEDKFIPEGNSGVSNGDDYFTKNYRLNFSSDPIYPTVLSWAKAKPTEENIVIDSPNQNAVLSYYLKLENLAKVASTLDGYRPTYTSLRFFVIPKTNLYENGKDSDGNKIYENSDTTNLSSIDLSVNKSFIPVDKDTKKPYNEFANVNWYGYVTYSNGKFYNSNVNPTVNGLYEIDSMQQLQINDLANFDLVFAVIKTDYYGNPIWDGGVYGKYIFEAVPLKDGVLDVAPIKVSKTLKDFYLYGADKTFSEEGANVAEVVSEYLSELRSDPYVILQNSDNNYTLQLSPFSPDSESTAINDQERQIFNDAFNSGKIWFSVSEISSQNTLTATNLVQLKSAQLSSTEIKDLEGRNLSSFTASLLSGIPNGSSSNLTIDDFWNKTEKALNIGIKIGSFASGDTSLYKRIRISVLYQRVAGSAPEEKHFDFVVYSGAALDVYFEGRQQAETARAEVIEISEDVSNNDTVTATYAFTYPTSKKSETLTVLYRDGKELVRRVVDSSSELKESGVEITITSNNLISYFYLLWGTSDFIRLAKNNIGTQQNPIVVQKIIRDGVSSQTFGVQGGMHAVVRKEVGAASFYSFVDSEGASATDSQIVYGNIAKIQYQLDDQLVEISNWNKESFHMQAPSKVYVVHTAGGGFFDVVSTGNGNYRLYQTTENETVLGNTFDKVTSIYYLPTNNQSDITLDGNTYSKGGIEIPMGTSTDYNFCYTKNENTSIDITFNFSSSSEVDVYQNGMVTKAFTSNVQTSVALGYTLANQTAYGKISEIKWNIKKTGDYYVSIPFRKESFVLSTANIQSVFVTYKVPTPLPDDYLKYHIKSVIITELVSFNSNDLQATSSNETILQVSRNTAEGENAFVYSFLNGSATGSDVTLTITPLKRASNDVKAVLYFKVYSNYETSPSEKDDIKYYNSLSGEGRAFTYTEPVGDETIVYENGQFQVYGKKGLSFFASDLVNLSVSVDGGSQAIVEEGNSYSFSYTNIDDIKNKITFETAYKIAGWDLYPLTAGGSETYFLEAEGGDPVDVYAKQIGQTEGGGYTYFFIPPDNITTIYLSTDGGSTREPYSLSPFDTIVTFKQDFGREAQLSLVLSNTSIDYHKTYEILLLPAEKIESEFADHINETFYAEAPIEVKKVKEDEEEEKSTFTFTNFMGSSSSSLVYSLRDENGLESNRIAFAADGSHKIESYEDMKTFSINNVPIATLTLDGDGELVKIQFFAVSESRNFTLLVRNKDEILKNESYPTNPVYYLQRYDSTKNIYVTSNVIRASLSASGVDIKIGATTIAKAYFIKDSSGKTIIEKLTQANGAGYLTGDNQYRLVVEQTDVNYIQTYNLGMQDDRLIPVDLTEGSVQFADLVGAVERAIFNRYGLLWQANLSVQPNIRFSPTTEVKFDDTSPYTYNQSTNIHGHVVEDGKTIYLLGESENTVFKPEKEFKFVFALPSTSKEYNIDEEYKANINYIIFERIFGTPDGELKIVSVRYGDKTITLPLGSGSLSNSYTLLASEIKNETTITFTVEYGGKNYYFRANIAPDIEIPAGTLKTFNGQTYLVIHKDLRTEEANARTGITTRAETILGFGNEYSIEFGDLVISSYRTETNVSNELIYYKKIKEFTDIPSTSIAYTWQTFTKVPVYNLSNGSAVSGKYAYVISNIKIKKNIGNSANPEYVSVIFPCLIVPFELDYATYSDDTTKQKVAVCVGGSEGEWSSVSAGTYTLPAGNYKTTSGEETFTDVTLNSEIIITEEGTTLSAGVYTIPTRNYILPDDFVDFSVGRGSAPLLSKGKVRVLEGKYLLPAGEYKTETGIAKLINIATKSEIIITEEGTILSAGVYTIPTGNYIFPNGKFETPNDLTSTLLYRTTADITSEKAGLSMEKVNGGLLSVNGSWTTEKKYNLTSAETGDGYEKNNNPLLFTNAEGKRTFSITENTTISFTLKDASGNTASLANVATIAKQKRNHDPEPNEDSHINYYDLILTVKPVGVTKYAVLEIERDNSVVRYYFKIEATQHIAVFYPYLNGETTLQQQLNAQGNYDRDFSDEKTTMEKVYFSNFHPVNGYEIDFTRRLTSVNYNTTGNHTRTATMLKASDSNYVQVNSETANALNNPLNKITYKLVYFYDGVETFSYSQMRGRNSFNMAFNSTQFDSTGILLPDSSGNVSLKVRPIANPTPFNLIIEMTTVQGAKNYYRLQFTAGSTYSYEVYAGGTMSGTTPAGSTQLELDTEGYYYDNNNYDEGSTPPLSPLKEISQGSSVPLYAGNNIDASDSGIPFHVLTTSGGQTVQEAGLQFAVVSNSDRTAFTIEKGAGVNEYELRANSTATDETGELILFTADGEVGRILISSKASIVLTKDEYDLVDPDTSDEIDVYGGQIYNLVQLPEGETSDYEQLMKLVKANGNDAVDSFEIEEIILSNNTVTSAGKWFASHPNQFTFPVVTTATEYTLKFTATVTIEGTPVNFISFMTFVVHPSFIVQNLTYRSTAGIVLSINNSGESIYDTTSYRLKYLSQASESPTGIGEYVLPDGYPFLINFKGGKAYKGSLTDFAISYTYQFNGGADERAIITSPGSEADTSFTIKTSALANVRSLTMTLSLRHLESGVIYMSVITIPVIKPSYTALIEYPDMDSDYVFQSEKIYLADYPSDETIDLTVADAFVAQSIPRLNIYYQYKGDGNDEAISLTNGVDTDTNIAIDIDLTTGIKTQGFKIATERETSGILEIVDNYKIGVKAVGQERVQLLRDGVVLASYVFDVVNTPTVLMQKNTATTGADVFVDSSKTEYQSFALNQGKMTLITANRLVATNYGITLVAEPKAGISSTLLAQEIRLNLYGKTQAGVASYAELFYDKDLQARADREQSIGKDLNNYRLFTLIKSTTEEKGLFLSSYNEASDAFKAALTIRTSTIVNSNDDAYEDFLYNRDLYNYRLVVNLSEGTTSNMFTNFDTAITAPKADYSFTYQGKLIPQETAIETFAYDVVEEETLSSLTDYDLTKTYEKENDSLLYNHIYEQNVYRARTHTPPTGTPPTEATLDFANSTIVGNFKFEWKYNYLFASGSIDKVISKTPRVGSSSIGNNYQDVTKGTGEFNDYGVSDFVIDSAAYFGAVSDGTTYTGYKVTISGTATFTNISTNSSSTITAEGKTLLAGTYTLPVGSYTLPAGNYTLPAGNYTLPAGTYKTTSGEETFTNISTNSSSTITTTEETLPAGSYTLPAGNYTLPAGSYTLPAGNYTLPAGTYKTSGFTIKKYNNTLANLLSVSGLKDLKQTHNFVVETTDDYVLVQGVQAPNGIQVSKITKYNKTTKAKTEVDEYSVPVNSSIHSYIQTPKIENGEISLSFNPFFTSETQEYLFEGKFKTEKRTIFTLSVQFTKTQGVNDYTFSLSNSAACRFTDEKGYPYTYNKIKEANDNKELSTGNFLSAIKTDTKTSTDYVDGTSQGLIWKESGNIFQFKLCKYSLNVTKTITLTAGKGYSLVNDILRPLLGITQYNTETRDYSAAYDKYLTNADRTTYLNTLKLSIFSEGLHGKQLYTTNTLFGEDTITDLISLQEDRGGLEGDIIDYEIYPHGAKKGGDIVHLHLQIGSDTTKYIVRLLIKPNIVLTTRSLVEVTTGAAGSNNTTSRTPAELGVSARNQITGMAIDTRSLIYSATYNPRYVNGGAQTNILQNGSIVFVNTVLGGIDVEITVRDAFGYSESFIVLLNNNEGVVPTRYNSKQSIYEGDEVIVYLEENGLFYSYNLLTQEILRVDSGNKDNYHVVIGGLQEYLNKDGFTISLAYGETLNNLLAAGTKNGLYGDQDLQQLKQQGKMPLIQNEDFARFSGKVIPSSENNIVIRISVINMGINYPGAAKEETLEIRVPIEVRRRFVASFEYGSDLDAIYLRDGYDEHKLEDYVKVVDAKNNTTSSMNSLDSISESRVTKYQLEETFEGNSVTLYGKQTASGYYELYADRARSASQLVIGGNIAEVLGLEKSKFRPEDFSYAVKSKNSGFKPDEEVSSSNSEFKDINTANYPKPESFSKTQDDYLYTVNRHKVYYTFDSQKNITVRYVASDCISDLNGENFELVITARNANTQSLPEKIVLWGTKNSSQTYTVYATSIGEDGLVTKQIDTTTLLYKEIKNITGEGLLTNSFDFKNYSLYACAVNVIVNDDDTKFTFHDDKEPSSAQYVAPGTDLRYTINADGSLLITYIPDKALSSVETSGEKEFMLVLTYNYGQNGLAINSDKGTTTFEAANITDFAGSITAKGSSAMVSVTYRGIVHKIAMPYNFTPYFASYSTQSMIRSGYEGYGVVVDSSPSTDDSSYKVPVSSWANGIVFYDIYGKIAGVNDVNILDNVSSKDNDIYIDNIVTDGVHTGEKATDFELNSGNFSYEFESKSNSSIDLGTEEDTTNGEILFKNGGESANVSILMKNVKLPIKGTTQTSVKVTLRNYGQMEGKSPNNHEEKAFGTNVSVPFSKWSSYVTLKKPEGTQGSLSAGGQFQYWNGSPNNFSLNTDASGNPNIQNWNTSDSQKREGIIHVVYMGKYLGTLAIAANTDSSGNQQLVYWVIYGEATFTKDDFGMAESVTGGGLEPKIGGVPVSQKFVGEIKNPEVEVIAKINRADILTWQSSGDSFKITTPGVSAANASQTGSMSIYLKKPDNIGTAESPSYSPLKLQMQDYLTGVNVIRTFTDLNGDSRYYEFNVLKNLELFKIYSGNPDEAGAIYNLPYRNDNANAFDRLLEVEYTAGEATTTKTIQIGLNIYSDGFDQVATLVLTVYWLQEDTVLANSNNINSLFVKSANSSESLSLTDWTDGFGYQEGKISKASGLAPSLYSLLNDSKLMARVVSYNENQDPIVSLKDIPQLGTNLSLNNIPVGKKFDIQLYSAISTRPTVTAFTGGVQTLQAGNYTLPAGNYSLNTNVLFEKANYEDTAERTTVGAENTVVPAGYYCIPAGKYYLAGGNYIIASGSIVVDGGTYTNSVTIPAGGKGNCILTQGIYYIPGGTYNYYDDDDDNASVTFRPYVNNATPKINVNAQGQVLASGFYKISDGGDFCFPAGNCVIIEGKITIDGFPYVNGAVVNIPTNDTSCSITAGIYFLQGGTYKNAEVLPEIKFTGQQGSSDYYITVIPQEVPAGTYNVESGGEFVVPGGVCTNHAFITAGEFYLPTGEYVLPAGSYDLPSGVYKTKSGVTATFSITVNGEIKTILVNEHGTRVEKGTYTIPAGTFILPSGNYGLPTGDYLIPNGGEFYKLIQTIHFQTLIDNSLAVIYKDGYQTVGQQTALISSAGTEPIRLSTPITPSKANNTFEGYKLLNNAGETLSLGSGVTNLFQPSEIYDQFAIIFSDPQTMTVYYVKNKEDGWIYDSSLKKYVWKGTNKILLHSTTKEPLVTFKAAWHPSVEMKLSLQSLANSLPTGAISFNNNKYKIGTFTYKNEQVFTALAEGTGVTATITKDGSTVVAGSYSIPAGTYYLPAGEYRTVSGSSLWIIPSDGSSQIEVTDSQGTISTAGFYDVQKGDYILPAGIYQFNGIVLIADPKGEIWQFVRTDGTPIVNQSYLNITATPYTIDQTSGKTIFEVYLHNAAVLLKMDQSGVMNENGTGDAYNGTSIISHSWANALVSVFDVTGYDTLMVILANNVGKIEFVNLTSSQELVIKMKVVAYNNEDTVETGNYLYFTEKSKDMSGLAVIKEFILSGTSKYVQGATDIYWNFIPQNLSEDAKNKDEVYLRYEDGTSGNSTGYQLTSGKVGTSGFSFDETNRGIYEFSLWPPRYK